MSLKWEKISETPLSAGHRKYTRKHFRLPSGIEDDYDVMDEGGIACVVPFTKDGKVILARQFRPGPEKILFGLPGGYIENRETPIKAASRELLEETGYRGKMRLVKPCYHGAYSNWISYGFVALDCEKVAEPLNDPKEPLEVVFVSVARFKKILRSGQITDTDVGFLVLDYLGC